MAGPLVRVNTLTEGITNDVSRLLNMGPGIVLEFIVPNRLELDGWNVLGTVTRGFDRIVQDENTTGDGSDVVYSVTDPDGLYGTILRTKDLHIRVDDEIYKVAEIPPVAPNEAQVYTLKCKTRTLRAAFDTTK